MAERTEASLLRWAFGRPLGDGYHESDTWAVASILVYRLYVQRPELRTRDARDADLFVMPMLLYGLAAMVWAISRIAGQRLTGYAVRLTLVWSLLASAPILLLLGLALGFIGPGVQAQIVGVLWLAVFFWFWIAGLLAAQRG